MEGNSPPANSGSMELLTNKSTLMSSKLMSLANPKPSAGWVFRNVRINIPSVGTVWYIPLSWLLHVYLEYSCISVMNTPMDSSFKTAIQGLLALSAVTMLLFTISAMVTMEDPPDAEQKYQKRTASRHLSSALRSQKYPLQALAGLFLINSYLLLQLHERIAKPIHTLETNVSATGHAEETEMNASSFGTYDWMKVSTGFSRKNFTYYLYCAPVLVPMIIHSVQHSDPVWKIEKLWGFMYSAILLLTGIKYLSSTFTFYVVSLLVLLTPQVLVQGFPIWLPVLYVMSVLLVFIFSVFLKIYLKLSWRVLPLGASATNLTLRKKIRSYPSPIGIICTTFLIVACDILPMLKLYFLLARQTVPFLLCLFAFNGGFCLLCICLSITIGVRRCLSNKAKAKPKKVSSRVCLANSFVYQSSPNAPKTKCLSK